MAEFRDRIEEAILSAVTELNEMRPDGAKIECSTQTELTSLDSLSKVNMVAFIEQKVEEQFGRAITFADAALVRDQDQDPFSSVSSLVDAIQSLMDDGDQT